MEIRYKTKRLEKSLESIRMIRKHYGHCSDSLELRKSELQAARNLAELSHKPPPRRHQLTGDYEGCWSISISKNWRIILRPVGDYNINDLTTITCIEISEIKDYH